MQANMRSGHNTKIHNTKFKAAAKSAGVVDHLSRVNPSIVGKPKTVEATKQLNNASASNAFDFAGVAG